MTPFQPNPTDVSPAGPADDTGDGLLLFFVFTVAVLTSTAVVVLIALVGEWWVLGFGFAIHVIVTAVVVLTVVHAIADRQRSIPDRHGLPSTSLSPQRSPAASYRAGARATTTLTPSSLANVPETRANALAAQWDRGSNQVPTMPSARHLSDHAQRTT